VRGVFDERRYASMKENGQVEKKRMASTTQPFLWGMVAIDRCGFPDVLFARLDSIGLVFYEQVYKAEWRRRSSSWPLRAWQEGTIIAPAGW
jgi:hypothetical protein